MPIRQDARLLAGIFTENYQFEIQHDRHYYMYMVSGTANVNRVPLAEGDGISFSEESQIEIVNPVDTEIIVFDLR